MPYDLEEGHPDCEEGEIGLVLRETGELVACHADRASAIDQIAAIEAGDGKSTGQTAKNPHTGMQKSADHLVGPSGGRVKDLDDKGKIGGFLVRFGSPTEHDLEKDYFTKETDFWLDGGEGQTATLWAHGTDPKIGQKRIDDGWGSLVVKDAGVWMEAQLAKRNEYEEAIRRLAEKGKLGLSSGTANHLVQREESKEGPDGVTEIKQWPLGLDGSLTPVPAEPRINVEPLKSLKFPSIAELQGGGRGVSGTTRNVQVPGSELRGAKQPSGDEIDARRKKFRETVNMSASEIERWADNDCSDLASENPGKVRSRVVGLLRTGAEDWGEKEYEEAGRVISFVSRMKGMPKGDPAREGCPSERDISLRNWGYDPTSADKEFGVRLFVLRNLTEANRKASHGDLSTGDYVRWDSAGGAAYGEVVQIGTGATLDPSTTDRTFETSEDEPGILIALVDREDGEVSRRTEDGEEMTVFHRPETVEVVPKSEVKVLAIPSGVPLYGKDLNAEPAMVRDLRAANRMLEDSLSEESVKGRNGLKNSSGDSGGENLKDTLESLVQMTS